MILSPLKMLKNNYGKIDVEKTSKTISESAKETSYNFIMRSLQSKNSNISESINTYTQHDYEFDTNFFSQNSKHIRMSIIYI